MKHMNCGQVNEKVFNLFDKMSTICIKLKSVIFEAYELWASRRKSFQLFDKMSTIYIKLKSVIFEAYEL